MTLDIRATVAILTLSIGLLACGRIVDDVDASCVPTGSAPTGDDICCSRVARNGICIDACFAPGSGCDETHPCCDGGCTNKQCP